MTATHNAGPQVTFGQTSPGSSGTNPEAGPSVTYQGDAVLDVRFPYNPGITGRGKINALLDSPYLLLVDAAPAKNSGTIGTVAIGQTAGTLGAYSSGQPGTGFWVTPGTPVVPFGQSYTAGNVVSALGVDVGFATCTTNGTTTISAISRMGALAPGVSVMVAGGASNAWVLASVVSVSASASTAVLDTAVSGTGTFVPIALANGSYQGPGFSARGAVAFYPWVTAGHAVLLDPLQGVTRGISVISTSASDTGTVTVRGYDIFGVPLTETITATGTTVAYGKKAWKFFTSITSSATAVGTISVKTSDVFGFGVRSDNFEYVNAYWAGAFMSAQQGWLAAITAAATATTGDTRGTLQVSAIGATSGGGIGTSQSDGTRRLAIFQTLPMYNLVAATPLDPTPLFGVTQFGG